MLIRTFATKILFITFLILECSIIRLSAHQNPSFPGQQEPLQGHHADQQPHQQQQQFGGEAIKDEG
jgi:hypothetical protein